jgi:hypothetical protein
MKRSKEIHNITPLSKKQDLEKKPYALIVFREGYVG